MATINIRPAPFTVLSSPEIRDNFVRTFANGLKRIGVANPNITEGSDIFIEGTAIGNELEVAMASIQVRADQLMPDTSRGDDLVRWAIILKLSNGQGGYGRRNAAGSTGFVTLLSALSVTLSVGEQLLDAAGKRFEVMTGGVYAPNSLIPVQAVDVGADTNHVETDVLTWAVPPYSANSFVTVAPGGLINGIDDESDEVLQQRVLTRLGNPPGGGNAAQVAEICTDSSLQVQAGFVYPALQGPATAGICVVAYPTATNKSRTLNSLTLNNTVIPYIVGNLPEHASFNVTESVDCNADIAIGLNIPDAITASPPGPGGGWLSGNPWPGIDPDNSINFAAVSAVTNSTSFVITARAGFNAAANVTKVSWAAATGDNCFKVVTAIVTSSVESPSGTYTITIDTPFVDIVVGDYIFPASVNGQFYMDAAVNAFAAMGPGEKRNPILSREFRHPTPATAWPNTLGGHILRAVSDSGEEVLDTQYYSRRPDSNLNYSFENTNGSVGVPTAVTDPPRIWIPRRIAFYRLT